MSTKEKKIEIIAGPCSAESEEQLLDTADGLNNIGVKVFRAGIWKPRSRYGSFEGVGIKALPWLESVRQKYGMEIMTEVATPNHVDCVLKYNIDRLWIGARTSVNPFMMSELSEALRGIKIPVFIKNPLCPDVELWKGAVERLLKADISDVRLIHRGFCLLDNSPYRNTPLWNLCTEVQREFGDIRLYCDPSHIAGKREYIPELCTSALNYDVDGFFIESHVNPDVALSDSKQQLKPLDLNKFLGEIIE